MALSETSAPALPLRSRLVTVDVMRGVLMCLITVAHATSNNLSPASLSRWIKFFRDAIFAMGTPGFCLVSGTLFGYLAATRADPGHLIRRYRKRGLELLLFAHVAIALLLYSPIGEGVHFGWFLVGRWYVTDALGVIFITCPFWVVRCRPRHRLWVGIALLIVGRTLHFSDLQLREPWQVMADFAFGRSPEAGVLIDTYSLLAICGIFLVGSTIGHLLATARRFGLLKRFVRQMLTGALLFVPLTALLIALYVAVKTWTGAGTLAALVLYPDRELTLFPAYLAVFVTVLAVFAHRHEVRDRVTRVDHVLELFGRTSLFTYLAQYFLVQTLPSLMDWSKRMTLPVLFAYVLCTFPVLYAMSWLYNRATTRLEERRAARAAAAAARTNAVGELA